MNNTFNASYEYACELDNKDKLAQFKNEFYLQEQKIYLDGNSLGLMSKRSEKSLLDIIDSWKIFGIDGWTKGKYPWYFLSEQLGELTAPLIGALPDEVIVTGSTTTNIHQAIATLYKPEGKRTKILSDDLNFPSDIYALQSQIRLKGYNPEENLVKVKSRDGRIVEEDDIIAAMTDEIALILLPGVLYRSGQILDMKRLTEEAHYRNIIIGFDLCHAIGSIPHQLSDWGVDFAIWCNYKYLNAGPGAVGGLYINKRHHGRSPGIAGWFSSNKTKQFDMEHTLVPAENAGAYQIGTPHLFSIAPLIGSLEIFKEAGIQSLREKSLNITRYMMELISTELHKYDFTLGNPTDDNRRGGHVYLEHSDAARICKALKTNGVIPDFRAPNGIRLAPVALYNSYEDVWRSIQILKGIMEREEYKQFKNGRDVVA